MAGDKIIVVIPVLNRGKGCNDVAVAHQLSYKTAFENLLFHTLRQLHPGDRTLLVDTAISECHTLVQEDKQFLEFACNVRHYPEQEELEGEVADLCLIKFSWLQGAGLNLSVCRFSTQ
jgi:hypothetical protein